MLLSRGKREAEPRGHPHQVRKRAGLHLSHHLASVSLDGDLARAQFGADLLVQKAGDDQCHDLALATSERSVAYAERLYFRLLAKCSAAAFDGVPDGVYQHFIHKWFSQEFHRTRLHGLDRHRHVAVAGDENDRPVSSFADD